MWVRCRLCTRPCCGQVADALNARGLRTTGGAEWSAVAVKRVLDRGQVPALSEKADRNLGQVRNADALGFGQPAAPYLDPNGNRVVGDLLAERIGPLLDETVSRR